MSTCGSGAAANFDHAMQYVAGKPSPARAPVKQPKGSPAPATSEPAVEAKVKAAEAVAAAAAAALPNPIAPAPAAGAAAGSKTAKKKKAAKQKPAAGVAVLPAAIAAAAAAAAAAPAPAPVAAAAPGPLLAPAAAAAGVAAAAAAAAAAAEGGDAKATPAKPVAVAKKPERKQTAEEIEAESKQLVNLVDYNVAHEVLAKDPYMRPLLDVFNAEIKRLHESQVASNKVIAAMHAAFTALRNTHGLTPEMLVPALREAEERALNAQRLSGAGGDDNTTAVADAMPSAPAPGVVRAGASAEAKAAGGSAGAEAPATDSAVAAAFVFPPLHMDAEGLARPDGVKSSAQVTGIANAVKGLLANPKGEFYETAKQLSDPLDALVKLLNENALAQMDVRAHAVIHLQYRYVVKLLSSTLRAVFGKDRAQCARLKLAADRAYDAYVAAKEQDDDVAQQAAAEAMCDVSLQAMARIRDICAVPKSKEYDEFFLLGMLTAAASEGRRIWTGDNDDLKLYQRQHEHDTVAVATRHASIAAFLTAELDRVLRQIVETKAERDRLAADMPQSLYVAPASGTAEVERQARLHGAQQAIARLEIAAESTKLALQLNDERFAKQKEALERAGVWAAKAEAAWTFVRLIVEIAEAGIAAETDRRTKQLEADIVVLEREFAELHGRVYVVFNRRLMQTRNYLAYLKEQKRVTAIELARFRAFGQAVKAKEQNARLTQIEVDAKAALVELKTRSEALAELDAVPDLDGILRRCGMPHPRDIRSADDVADLTDDSHLLEGPAMAAAPAAPAAAPAAAGAAGAAAAAAPMTPAKPAAAVMAGTPVAAAAAHALPPAAAASPAPAPAPAAVAAGAGAASAQPQPVQLQLQTEGGVSDSYAMIETDKMD